MFARILGVSVLGGEGWTIGCSSFSESLPPELNIETSVSIPIWSQPSTDLDLVAKGLALVWAFDENGWEFAFLVSTSSGNSSGESSKSSLSLFSVKFTLFYQSGKSYELKHDDDNELNNILSLMMVI